MSKKKNTLQDLDDFLKQQAATLVTPETLSETVEAAQVIEKPIEKVEVQTPKPGSEKNNLDEFQIAYSQDPTFRKRLYDFIIASLETQKDSLPEDKMLINTALYLKNGDNWKNAIRQYWQGK